MKIQIEPHTLQRAIERRATETEILDTINSGVNILAKSGRLGKSKIFHLGMKETGDFLKKKN